MVSYKDINVFQSHLFPVYITEATSTTITAAKYQDYVISALPFSEFLHSTNGKICLYKILRKNVLKLVHDK